MHYHLYLLPILLTILNCQPNKYSVSEEEHWIKQYAFCKCVQYSVEDGTYFSEQDVSLSILTELAASNIPFDLIDSIARVASNNIKPPIIEDYEGKKPVLMGCLKFYESRELKIILTEAKKKDRR